MRGFGALLGFLLLATLVYAVEALTSKDGLVVSWDGVSHTYRVGKGGGK